MDLDRDAAPHNTPGARSSVVGAPTWADGHVFASFPGCVPPELAGWGSSGNVGGCLVLWGPVGTGKTGLAVCALRALAAAGAGSTFYWNMVTGPGLPAAIERGEAERLPSPCWFESWPRLLAMNRRPRWDEEGWFESLEERVSALVLDDVGVDTGTPFRESFLLRHLEWAASRRGRSLILTVNDPPWEWPAVFGERSSDRMQSRFTVVPVEGPSLR